MKSSFEVPFPSGQYAFFEVRFASITNTLPGFIALVIFLSLACLITVIAVHRLFKDGSRQLTGIAFVRAVPGEWRWLFALMVVTGAFLVSNHLLLRGLAVGIWDVDAAYFPYQTLVADFARAGQFLHWDPWSNGGLPSGGDPQFGAYSPINLAIGLVAGGTPTGFLIYWMLMWWLGGVGMLLLARHLQAPVWGGVVVALGFLFCGTYIGHAEHTSLVSAFSMLPFVIWRLDVALTSRRLLPAVQAGALWGTSALAGYPGIVIITLLFVGLWTAGRWFCTEPPVPTPAIDGFDHRKKQPLERLSRGIAAVAAVPLVGVLVLAPTYFAYFYEGTGTTTRVGALSRTVAVAENALAPGAVLSLSSPYLPILKWETRSAGENGLWPGTDVSGCGLYTGAIICALALMALFNTPRERWRWWLLGIGLLCLGLAVGPVLPLRGWLYDWVYPTRFFRHAAIFRGYFLFAIAVLALIGTRDLAAAFAAANDRVFRRFFIASFLSATAATSVLWYYIDTPPIDRLTLTGEPLALLHAATVWGGICAIALIIWKARALRKHWGVPILLVILGITDALMTSSISTSIIAETRPEAVRRWEILRARHSASLDLAPRGLQREEKAVYSDGGYGVDITNDQMITKIAAFDAYATAVNNYQVQMSGDATMRGMAGGPDRIWFSKEAARVAPTAATFEAFRKRVGSLGGFPLLVHSSREMLDQNRPTVGRDVEPEIARLPAAQAVPVNVIKYFPDELTFDVECAAAGWLLVTDRWARSWRAEVNGVPAEMYGGNFIFRAVYVSAGKNRVKFIYRPRGFAWLLILSWGTLAVVLVSSVRAAGSRLDANSN